jgi:hypothetical protein
MENKESNMSDEDVDNELVSMLESEPESPPQEPPPIEKPPTPPQDVIPVSEPKVTHNIVVEPTKSELIKPEKEPQDKLGLRKLVLDFSKTADVVSKNYESDRNRVEVAVAYFEHIVRDAQDNSKKLSPAFVEGYVKLLAIKAEINTSATSLLDSIAKLVSAAKNNNIIINLGGADDNNLSLNLEELLSQAPKSDEMPK